MGKLPYYPMYPMDWDRDMEEHPLEIEGAWIRICNKLWWSKTKGRAEKTLAQWAKILRVDENKAKEILEYLRSQDISTVYGEPTNSQARVTLISRRMVRDQRIREIRKKCGEKGGNPLLKNSWNLAPLRCLDNQNLTTQDNQNPSKLLEYEDNTTLNKVVKEKKKRKILSLEEYFQFTREEIRACLERDRADFKRAYPAINLDQEAAAALTWLKNNPAKRKKEIGRFFNSWLARQQEKAGKFGAPQERERKFGNYPERGGNASRNARIIDDETERINAEWRAARALKDKKATGDAAKDAGGDHLSDPGMHAK